MGSRVAAALTAGIALLCCANQALPASGKAPTVLVSHGWGGTATVSSNARLIVGKARGLLRARPGRPVRVAVRARGANVRRILVTLRRRGGKVVLGQSRRFNLAVGERKVVRIPVKQPLKPGKYTARAKGRVAGGPVLHGSRGASRPKTLAR